MCINSHIHVYRSSLNTGEYFPITPFKKLISIQMFGDMLNKLSFSLSTAVQFRFHSLQRKISGMHGGRKRRLISQYNLKYCAYYEIETDIMNSSNII